MPLELRPVETNTDLAAVTEIRGRTDPDASLTVEDLRAGRGFLVDLYDLIAWESENPVGFAYAALHPGWERKGWALGEIVVLPEHRRRGIGRVLHDAVLTHARALGKAGLQVEAREDDAQTLGFLDRRGYTEVERQQGLVLELAGLEPPPADAPEGIGIVTRRPEHERALYELTLQANEDIPGVESEHALTFEGWRASEVARPSKPAEFTFIALSRPASLSVTPP